MWREGGSLGGVSYRVGRRGPSEPGDVASLDNAIGTELWVVRTRVELGGG